MLYQYANPLSFKTWIELVLPIYMTRSERSTSRQHFGGSRWN